MNNSLLTYGSILIAAALLCAGFSPVAAAENGARQSSSGARETSDADSEEKEGDSEAPGRMERFLRWSGEPHRQVSNRLENLSRSVDSIFGEERIYQEATDSHLQVGGGVVIERGGTLSFEEDLSLKIDLPQTEERVKLVLESEDDDDDIFRNDDSSTNQELNNAEDKDYSAALQFFIRETDRWNISVSPGIRFRTPPDPFARLRIRRSQKLGTTWQSRLTERLTGYLHRGPESRTTLDFERRTGEGQLFRLSSRVLWREEFENDNVHLSQSAQLFKRLTKRDSIAYSATVVWETKPNLHHEAYIADIRWRRRIHEKWLFVEIRPEARFDRENHFRLEPSLTLSLEILFGKSYLRQEEKQG